MKKRGRLFFCAVLHIAQFFSERKSKMCMVVRLYDVRGAIAEQLSSDGRDEDIPTTLDELNRRFYSVDEDEDREQREVDLINDFIKGVNKYV